MNHHAHALHRTSPFAFLNAALAVAAVALLVYYVVQANAIAAATWQMTQMSDRASALQDRHNASTAERAALLDRASLETFAAAHGLVPAQQISYIVPSSDVAVAR